MSKVVVDAKIESRRLQVADLLLAGANQREIATALHVSLGTINSDVKAIRTEWRKETKYKFDDLMVHDLRRVEAAISAIWNAVMNGSPEAVRMFLALLERKARMVGYDGLWRAELDHSEGREASAAGQGNSLPPGTIGLLGSMAQMNADEMGIFLNNLLISRSPIIIENPD